MDATKRSPKAPITLESLDVGIGLVQERLIDVQERLIRIETLLGADATPSPATIDARLRLLEQRMSGLAERLPSDDLLLGLASALADLQLLRRAGHPYPR